jgi:hypothetical protein
MVEALSTSPGRMPSPQPANLGGAGQPHRVINEPGHGYIAPKFEGKEEQMEK